MTLLDATDVSKSFAGVQALNDVSFDLRAGEVHALVGENGAGKSTFIKIASGVETPDAGALTIAGRTVSSLTPTAARDLGVAAIQQQPSLFPTLSVAENIGLALERPGPLGRVRWTTRRRTPRDLVERIGAENEPGRPVETPPEPRQPAV